MASKYMCQVFGGLQGLQYMILHSSRSQTLEFIRLFRLFGIYDMAFAKSISHRMAIVAAKAPKSPLRKPKNGSDK